MKTGKIRMTSARGFGLSEPMAAGPTFSFHSVWRKRLATPIRASVILSNLNLRNRTSADA